MTLPIDAFQCRRRGECAAWRKDRGGAALNSEESEAVSLKFSTGDGSETKLQHLLRRFAPTAFAATLRSQRISRKDAIMHAASARAFALALLFTSCTLAAESADTAPDVVRLRTGDTYEIVTAARTYWVKVTDGSTGESETSVSRDGGPFSPTAKIYLLGATAGTQGDGGRMMVLMGQVRVGLSLELGLGSLNRQDRVLSERVIAVRLLR